MSDITNWINMVQTRVFTSEKNWVTWYFAQDDSTVFLRSLILDEMSMAICDWSQMGIFSLKVLWKWVQLLNSTDVKPYYCEDHQLGLCARRFIREGESIDCGSAILVWIGVRARAAVHPDVRWSSIDDHYLGGGPSLLNHACYEHSNALMDFDNDYEVISIDDIEIGTAIWIAYDHCQEIYASRQLTCAQCNLRQVLKGYSECLASKIFTDQIIVLSFQVFKQPRSHHNTLTDPLQRLHHPHYPRLRNRVRLENKSPSKRVQSHRRRKGRLPRSPLRTRNRQALHRNEAEVVFQVIHPGLRRSRSFLRQTTPVLRQSLRPHICTRGRTVPALTGAAPSDRPITTTLTYTAETGNQCRRLAHRTTGTSMCRRHVMFLKFCGNYHPTSRCQIFRRRNRTGFMSKATTRTPSKSKALNCKVFLDLFHHRTRRQCTFLRTLNPRQLSSQGLVKRSLNGFSASPIIGPLL